MATDQHRLSITSISVSTRAGPVSIFYIGIGIFRDLHY